MVFLQVMKSIHKLLYILVLWCLMDIILPLGCEKNTRRLGGLGLISGGHSLSI